MKTLRVAEAISYDELCYLAREPDRTDLIVGNEGQDARIEGLQSRSVARSRLANIAMAALRIGSYDRLVLSGALKEASQIVGLAKKLGLEVVYRVLSIDPSHASRDLAILPLNEIDMLEIVDESLRVVLAPILNPGPPLGLTPLLEVDKPGRSGSHEVTGLLWVGEGTKSDGLTDFLRGASVLGLRATLLWACPPDVTRMNEVLGQASLLGLDRALRHEYAGSLDLLRARFDQAVERREALVNTARFYPPFSAMSLAVERGVLISSFDTSFAERLRNYYGGGIRLVSEGSVEDLLLPEGGWVDV